ncbi:hypothetical protein [Effusibacillus lacus]|uniref:Uncharacterized protein n=1 Tax=Effusibacillus lacus TaxID=1348429 RepID=A0A292YDJ3_9BACL|nr:hypothetical protein [Effusibacillus lacus]TCS72296.1 hypothetical protein EDD64_12249 [Effusibacillus lacus]GAX90232.1 hypothetical protein EFBL_1858 [Effusibacillus lacus]
MLYHPKSIQLEEERLLVHIPEAAYFIEKWRGLGEEFKGLSMRWAAGRDAKGPFIVIGVRHEGRGFDVALAQEAWDLLGQEPETFVVRYGAEAGNTDKETAIELPEGSFGEFIESCQKQAAEDPEKIVIGEIARYFA